MATEYPLSDHGRLWLTTRPRFPHDRSFQECLRMAFYALQHASHEYPYNKPWKAEVERLEARVVALIRAHDDGREPLLEAAERLYNLTAPFAYSRPGEVQTAREALRLAVLDARNKETDR